MIRTGLATLALALAAPLVAQSLPGEMPAEITAIDGVIAGDAQWEMIWSGPMTADGMTTTPDGNVLFAQEQSNAVFKLWHGGGVFVEVPYVLGAGAASVASDGSVLAVERACTDPGLGGLSCDKPSAVVQLQPSREVIADGFADGSSLGRLNDLHADGDGGAYFTQGNLYHTTAAGDVTTLYEAKAFTNGLATSRDGNVLYVTDMREVIAVDLLDGAASRVFATLDQDTAGFGGDGMALDAAGRLYVTADAGIYVFDESGAKLGVIPVPRRSITLTFAGPDRDWLYVGAMGSVTPAGAAWETPEGVRNVAMTIYRVKMNW